MANEIKIEVNTEAMPTASVLRKIVVKPSGNIFAHGSKDGFANAFNPRGSASLEIAVDSTTISSMVKMFFVQTLFSIMANLSKDFM